MTLYDPEKWLETLTRGIKDYVEANINTSIYEVIMEFPAAELSDRQLPNPKTVIHFEIDASPDAPLGFGDNIFAQNYDSVAQVVKPQEARLQMVNFDVGVWAWDRSGGTTSRMRAKQMLSNLFGGAKGKNGLYAATAGADGGVEILSFTGGRFVTDTINDVRVYRMVDCSLDVRVYSRTPIPSEGAPTIEDIQQDNSGITIIG